MQNSISILQSTAASLNKLNFSQMFRNMLWNGKTLHNYEFNGIKNKKKHALIRQKRYLRAFSHIYVPILFRFFKKILLLKVLKWKKKSKKNLKRKSAGFYETLNKNCAICISFLRLWMSQQILMNKYFFFFVVDTVVQTFP